ncbi:MAG: hypothetical protein Q7R99_03140 [bacterium]|nr:hypothetical protein [bacterium]
MKVFLGKNFFLLFAVVFLFLPLITSARVGVGIGTGEIKLEKPLKPGGFYDLPILAIFNTGTEASDYNISIAFYQDSTELRPSKEWFSFTPADFYLEPGKSQTVRTTITVPLKTTPGKYFCFIEGFPVAKTNFGGASVGVAAAAKLYFSVQPANIFQAIFYKITFLFHKYSVWFYIVGSIILVAVIVSVARKFLSFNLTVKK